MKKILLPLAAALAFAGAAHAAPITTAPSPFNVTVNLTSVCSVSSAPTAVVFNYTSLGGAVASTGGNYSVTCTNNLPYTMALDAVAQTFPTTGLNYTLSLNTAGSTGTGAAQAFTMTGGMVGGQGGTCAGQTCSETVVRNLTITY
jgi:spore coat protein U-like protein